MREIIFDKLSKAVKSRTIIILTVAFILTLDGVQDYLLFQTRLSIGDIDAIMQFIIIIAAYFKLNPSQDYSMNKS